MISPVSSSALGPPLTPSGASSSSAIKRGGGARALKLQASSTDETQGQSKMKGLSGSVSISGGNQESNNTIGFAADSISVARQDTTLTT
jgi:hypothetical protein